ncbi:DNA-binding response regulator [Vibrio sp. 10N.286.49.C2]|uniref:response regulator transcription factor n=1 Tax=unclassified Vibrio TaxID=2614977 RepID=UPI000C8307AC|nr:MULTISPECIES: response regulator transcription factor [unclassified Vibrio]PMH38200.1 DNA-binding response regulator [Vibrio sp. 10N.286.49.C2]PMH53593.1 DNA-binding response regulator [Vibrio sp. 10N.286.49.B1]
MVIKERPVTEVLNPDAATIMLVEDDEDLAGLIQMHLKFQGHHVIRATSVKEGIERYSEQSIDMLVLDRGLPDGDGLDVCLQLRHQNDWVPIIMMTARDSEMDKVDGLEAGVDDYITKPFSVLEFQARVRNTLRRHHRQHKTEHLTPIHSETKHESPALSLGSLSIYPEQHTVALAGQHLDLTATEFTLLHFLARRPGRVYSKDELLEHVWDTHHSGYHHTVCSTINRLRTKLHKAHSVHNYIQTVWGVGYKFLPDSV